MISTYENGMFNYSFPLIFFFL